MPAIRGRYLAAFPPRVKRETHLSPTVCSWGHIQSGEGEQLRFLTRDRTVVRADRSMAGRLVWMGSDTRPVGWTTRR